MAQRYFLITAAFITAFAVIPTIVFAQSGIISGSVWVSPPQPEEGQEVRIYTAIFNDREETLTGVAVFRDGEKVLAEREFSVPENDIVGLSIPWTVTAGKHLFSVSLQNTNLVSGDGASQPILLERGGAQTDLAITPSFDHVASKGKETAAGVAEGITEKGETAVAAVSNAVPESVKKQVASTLETTEEFRKDGAEFLREKKQQSASEEFPGDEGSESGSHADEETYPIVKTIAAGLWSVPLAVFEHAILFYLALVALLFFVIRWLLRKVRRGPRRRQRREYDEEDDEEE